MTRPARTRLDYAERWMRDSLLVLRPASTTHQSTVDMSRALERLEALRREGVAASATHLLVHAVARALAANPDLHVIVSGNRRYRPDRVDIGLSVTGDIFVAPVLIVEGADRKTLAEIAAEVTRRTPQVRLEDRQRLATLRRWGWLVPFGMLRRAILSVLFASPSYRCRIAGTFQVSTVPVESAATAAFVAAGVLVAGGIRTRVVAVEGQPALRPEMTLTLCGDHGVWDGRAAARLLSAVKTRLESGGDT